MTNNIDKYLSEAHKKYLEMLAKDSYYNHLQKQLQFYNEEISRVKVEAAKKVKEKYSIDGINLYGSDVKEKIHDEEDYFS